MIAIINGHEYELASGYSTNNEKSKYYLNIYANSMDELVADIGNQTTLEIPGEFVVANLSLEEIAKRFITEEPTYYVTLSLYPFDEALARHEESIEVISQAIEELAEIIG